MNTLAGTFDFEGNAVRTATDDDGAFWFVALDVCRCLEIDKHHQAVGRLDDDERGTYSVGTPSGNQDMACVNEAGLYHLILTSRKAAAKRFKRWVCHEVLPAIRATGRYAPEGAAEDTAAALLDPEEERLWSARIALYQRVWGRDAARWAWLNSPLPNPDIPEAAVLAPAPRHPGDAWFDEGLTAAPGARLSAREAYDAYCGWCRGRGIVPVTMQTFARRVRHHADPAKIGRTAYYCNVALAAGDKSRLEPVTAP